MHFLGPRWYPHIRSDHQPTDGQITHPTFSQHTTPAAPHFSPWILVLCAAGLMIALTAWWTYHQRTRERLKGAARPSGGKQKLRMPGDLQVQVDHESLAAAFAAAMSTLETMRVPADAILAAWVGLQHAAEGSGVPRTSAETPTEFTARILARTSADDVAVLTLLNLYLRVRFGERPATAADVDAARSAVASIAVSWDALTDLVE